MYSNSPYNILDGGEQEYYTSAPFKLTAGKTATQISWDADLGPKTWVKAQIRHAESMEALDDATWSGPGNPESWYENGGAITGGSGKNSWIQYRLALGATNGGCTPRITEVRVHYQKV